MTIYPLEVSAAFHNLKMALHAPMNWNDLSISEGKFQKGISYVFEHIGILQTSLAQVASCISCGITWKEFKAEEKKYLIKFVHLIRLNNPIVWFGRLQVPQPILKEVEPHFSKWYFVQYKGVQQRTLCDDALFMGPKNHYSGVFSWLGHDSFICALELDDRHWTCAINPCEIQDITPTISKEEFPLTDVVLYTDLRGDHFNLSTAFFLQLFHPVVIGPPDMRMHSIGSSEKDIIYGMEPESKCFFKEYEVASQIWLTSFSPSPLCTAEHPLHSTTYVLSLPCTTVCDNYFHLLILGDCECCSSIAVGELCWRIKEQFSRIDMAIMSVDWGITRTNQESYPEILAYAASLLNPAHIFAAGWGTWVMREYGQDELHVYDQFYEALKEVNLSNHLIPADRVTFPLFERPTS